MEDYSQMGRVRLQTYTTWMSLTNIMLSKEPDTKVCILGDPSHMKF